MEKFESQFLKEKYWSKKEFREVVEKSAKKKEKRGFEISQKPQEKIPYYLERLEKIVSRIDPETRERGKLFLETSLYPRFIIKPENISTKYIKDIFLGNFAELHGYDRKDLRDEKVKQEILNLFKQEFGQEFENYQILQEEIERIKKIVITDQKNRLKQWFEYLTSEETRNIPSALRYWAFVEMLNLGSYNEETKTFNKRTKTTVAPFPQLNHQALSYVFDEISRKRRGQPSKILSELEDETKQIEFHQRLQSENFGKLYAFALEYVNSLRLPTERLSITKGQWVCFSKGSSPEKLTKALSGFNTNWCIAAESVAEEYLRNSDIWIYFSEDSEGKNTIPRACIVVTKELGPSITWEEIGVTEVRGIISSGESSQHLDSYIIPIVEEKLKELPGGKKWQETMEDMKRLTKIYHKHHQKEPLTREDLLFLYEIERPIKSFGYGFDPRIEEIKKERNLKEDAVIILNCKPQEIACTKEEINENTKIYIGPFFPGIFKTNIETIYHSFPNKIISEEIEVKPFSFEEFEKEISKHNQQTLEKSQQIAITREAKEILSRITTAKYQGLKEKKFLSLVYLGYDKTIKEAFRLSDLFTIPGHFKKILRKAKELGLEPCPAEVAPILRLIKKKQSPFSIFVVGMEPIENYVFLLAKGGEQEKLFLHAEELPKEPKKLEIDEESFAEIDAIIFCRPSKTETKSSSF